MKKLSLFLALAALAIGCKKDKTTQKDLCAGVICANGGICVNGQCDCPPGYSGPDCSNEVAPVKMRVGSITLNTFPATDAGGAGWDLTSGPDVYINIEDLSGSVLFTSSHLQNLTGPNTWTTNFEFSSPTATYVVRVYDYDDFDTDDFMGGIQFTPYSPGHNFPATLELSCSNCVVNLTCQDVIYFH